MRGREVEEAGIGCQRERFLSQTVERGIHCANLITSDERVRGGKTYAKWSCSYRRRFRRHINESRCPPLVLAKKKGKRGKRKLGTRFTDEQRIEIKELSEEV